MANVKSDIDVNAFPPVDEVCSNSDVVAAAQKNGYEEFPWSDMGLSEVHMVRNVTVRVPGVGKRQVWVFDIHPLFNIIYQQPETLPPEFEAQLASAPVKQQAEKGIAMSEITKEQTFFRFFLPIVGVFSLAVVGLGYGLSLTRDNNDTMNKQIAENNVKKIHALAKAHPAKFSSYEMSTLRCEIGKPGIIRTPIDCYVNGHNGEEVHLSNTRIENLVNS